MKKILLERKSRRNAGGEVANENDYSMLTGSNMVDFEYEIDKYESDKKLQSFKDRRNGKRAEQLNVCDFEEEIDKCSAAACLNRKKNEEVDTEMELLGEAGLDDDKDDDVLRNLNPDTSKVEFQQNLQGITYICKICGRHYRNQSQSLVHINKVHGITNLDTIHYCKSSYRHTQVFWHRVNLTVEEQLSELDNRRKEPCYVASPYKCYQCAMAFQSVDTFENHNKSHHVRGRFMCNICISLFATESDLLRHERYHKHRFKCSICGVLLKCHTFITTRITHEAMHANTKSEEGLSTYDCVYCNETFQHYRSLGAHMRNTHFSSRAHKCNRCDKIFNTIRDYSMHMLKHAKYERHESYDLLTPRGTD